jgi:acyl dehydratase
MSSTTTSGLVVGEVRATEGPFGTTIAHGYPHPLSVVPFFLGQLPRGQWDLDGGELRPREGQVSGSGPVGSSLRASAEIVDVQPGPGSKQMTVRVSVACDAAEKPVCVADVVILFVA